MSDETSGSLIFLGVLYFAPTILALIRGHLSLLAIFLLNLMLGWSVLGWIVALVWAATSGTKLNRQIAVYGRPQNTLGDAAEAFGHAVRQSGHPRAKTASTPNVMAFVAVAVGAIAVVVVARLVLGPAPY